MHPPPPPPPSIIKPHTPNPTATATAIALHILMPSAHTANLHLTPLSLAGALLIISGSALRLKCYRTLGNLYTFTLSIRPTHRLVTRGPYRVVRHPAYTGTFLLFAGMGPWYASRGSWIRESGILGTVPRMTIVVGVVMVYVQVGVGLFRHMREEDRLLKAAFGKEWED